MTVGELTERLDVGQSTISHHLAKLADVRFVLVDQRGTSSLWRINTNCIACFPSAVDVVMGRIPAEFTGALERERTRCSGIHDDVRAYHRQAARTRVKEPAADKRRGASRYDKRHS